jgi:hypothetical protein
VGARQVGDGAPDGWIGSRWHDQVRRSRVYGNSRLPEECGATRRPGVWAYT